jgi:hypothetical protein
MKILDSNRRNYKDSVLNLTAGCILFYAIDFLE